MMNSWTVPNLLTIIRIILIPIFIIALSAEKYIFAWMIFAAAGITDALDGFLARILRQRSWLGAFLDPLADKLLLISSFVCLAWKGWLPFWLAVMVVSRDFLILAGMGVLQFFGVDIKYRINPTLISKLNTLFQLLLIMIVLLLNSTSWDMSGLLPVFISAVAILTFISGIHYIVIGFRYLNTKSEAA